MQREILSTYVQHSLSSLPHGFRRASPASVSLTLPACLINFSLPHTSRSSLTASGVPHQLLSPLRFRLASPAFLSLTLPEAPSRLPACLTSLCLLHGFRCASLASLSLTLPACLISFSLLSPSRSQIPNAPFPSTSNLDYLCFIQKGKALH